MTSFKNIVVLLIMIAVFLIAGGALGVFYFRKPPSPVAALIPNNASQAFFVEQELFTHPVASLLAGAIVQDADVVAAMFSGSPEARAVFFRDDTGWVLLSKTELEAPMFQRDTVAGVF